MKLPIICGVLLFLGQMNVSFCQVKCGTTPPTEVEKEVMYSHFQTFLQNQKHARTTFYRIPVKANIIYPTSTNQGLTETDVRNIISHANSYLTNAGIELYLLNNQVNLVNNDKFNSFKVSDEAELRKQYDVLNAINVYFTKTITDQYATTLGGYASLPTLSASSNRLIYSYFDRTNEDYEELKNKLFLHEIGHYFGLLHTFQDSNHPDISKRELVTRSSGSNCGYAGDQLCDTAADPFERLPTIAAYNCFQNVPSDLTDAFGDNYIPPTNNIMSYHQQCGHVFTPQQYQKMQASFAIRFSPSAEYKLVNPSPNFISVNGFDKKVYCNGDEVKINLNVEGLYESNNQIIVELSDKNGLNYQQINANRVANQMIFRLPNTTPEGESYRVRLTATRPETFSPISENFTVKNYSTTSLSVNKAAVESGESVELSVNFTGSGAWNFTLSDGTIFKDIRQNPFRFTKQVFQNTSYWLNAASNVCGNAIRYGSATVSILEPKIQTTALAVPYVCQGQTINLSVTASQTNTNDEFFIQLSDANGSNFVNLPTINSTYTLVTKIPENAAIGGSYRLKVITKNAQTFSSPIGPFSIYQSPQPPTVNSPAIYCEGVNNKPLEAKGQNLRWYVNESDLRYYGSVIPNTTKSGTTSFYVSQTNSVCESKKVKLDVIIKPLANATISGNNFIKLKDSTQIVVNLTGDAPWEFTLSDNRTFKTSRDVNYVYVKPSKSTDYTIKDVKNLCGFGNTFGTAKITVLQPLSSEDDLVSRINVFPNPSSEKLKIELKLPQNSMVNYVLVDVSGRILLDKNQRINSYPQIEEIDLSEHFAGEYILKITTNQYTSSRKIVVQK
jgi:predicted Zn-dependent protease with MMP-like domain